MYSNKFLNISDVSEMACLSRSSVRLWESEGRFPKSIKLSPTKRVWRLSDINEWIDSMYAANQNYSEANNE
jgi:predicted DNA-binding transcriptional regulator AlpA